MMNPNNIPRMRTIKEAIAEIKQIDDRSAINEWRLRQLVISGAIPSKMAGKKYLVNLNDVFQYFTEEKNEDKSIYTPVDD